MKALVLHNLKSPLQFEQRPEAEPAEGQVVVALKAAALNRRDHWITQGKYPGIRTPVILGSDGAGVVSRIGDGVPHHWSGRQVIINPGWHWGDDMTAQGPDFQILGMPADGTFASAVAVPAEYLHLKPDHLDWRESAALPLAGLTAYRAVCTHGRVRAGEKVLVTGVGGGVATFAVQFASLCGAEVVVTSSSPTKLNRARDIGASAGYDYTRADWANELKSEHGSINLIIDSAGGDGYASLIDIAAPGGRVVNYGATAGPPKTFDLLKVFWKQLHVTGSTMGSPEDFACMLELVNKHQLRPAIDEVFPLERGNDALQRMRDAEQFGKIVLDPA